MRAPRRAQRGWQRLAVGGEIDACTWPDAGLHAQHLGRGRPAARPPHRPGSGARGVSDVDALVDVSQERPERQARGEPVDDARHRGASPRGGGRRSARGAPAARRRAAPPTPAETQRTSAKCTSVSTGTPVAAGQRLEGRHRVDERARPRRGARTPGAPEGRPRGDRSRHTARVDNASIADRLDAFASLLELAEANPYTIRAYRRGGGPDPRRRPRRWTSSCAPGACKELRGIGPGIEARLRELLETGQIAELAELERELAPGLVGLGRYLGLTAKRSVEIARALRRPHAGGVPRGRGGRPAARRARRRAEARAQILDGARARGRAAAAARDPPAARPRARGRDRGRARRRAGGRPAPLARLVRAARGGLRRAATRRRCSSASPSCRRSWP